MTFDEYLLASLPGLLRYAVMLTGDAHLAEDVVQDTMVRVHTHWRRVQAADSPDRNVRRMVTNTYLSWRRGGWFRRAVTMPVVPELRVPDGTDEVTVRHEMWERLAGLPGRQRAALVLRYPGEGNTVVDSRDVTIDLNGRSVRQYVVVYAVGNRRDCLMVWTERDGLYASVGVTERTAAGDHGVTCGAGERIVRELSTEPTVVPRLVTPGLVPHGFRLVATGSEWETWCPDHLTQATDQQCLMVTRVNELMSASWLDKWTEAVHGHDAWIATAETLVQVYVRGYLQFTLPLSMKLEDADLIRRMAAMAPAAGW